MPRNDSYNQAVPYPVLGDAADIEAAMQALVNGIVPKPVPGMITYLVAEDRWEGRQADGTWLLLSDGPWTPITYANGHSALSGSPGWRKKAGGGIELRGIVKANDGKLNDSGDVLKFGAIPSAVAPGALRHFPIVTNRTTINGISRMSGRLSVYTNGDLMYYVENGGGQGTATAPGWFSLDGIQFSPSGD
jgi:hypothetical protein